MTEPPSAPHSIGEFVRGVEKEGRLRGFACRACGFVTATWGVACSNCGADGLEERALSATGSVVAHTVVAVPTEERANDAPYAYVIVALDGGGRISGWMPSVRSPETLAPGSRVRLSADPRPGVRFEPDPTPTEDGSRDRAA